MIAVLDERHVTRGYDPYNSADQPWVLAAMNARRRRDKETDAMIRIGMKIALIRLYGERARCLEARRKFP